MKLNQVIALIQGRKTRSQKEITALYHQLERSKFFEGITRTYRPKNDDGDTLPEERKSVQVTARNMTDALQSALTDLFNTVFTQDESNCAAKADIKIDDTVIISQAPVTFLLFLEKQLIDINSFVRDLPTLDPAEQWEYSEAAECFQSAPTETVRNVKTLANHVLAEATKEHPAQVQTYQREVLVGYWRTIKLHGGIPQAQKTALINRVTRLHEAVKKAREEANGMEVTYNNSIAPSIFDYLFKPMVDAQP